MVYNSYLYAKGFEYMFMSLGQQAHKPEVLWPKFVCRRRYKHLVMPEKSNPMLYVTRKRKNKWVRENMFLLLTILGVTTGIAFGFSLRSLHLSQDAIMLISYPGEIFMRLLNLLILPLIVSSIITGTSSLNAKANGKIVLRTFGFFLVTSAINAILGTFLASLMHPGDNTLKSTNIITHEKKNRSLLDSILDLGRNIVTENIFQATFQQAYTNYANTSVASFRNTTGTMENHYLYTRTLKYRQGSNTLGIVFFCLMFGTVLGTLGEKSTIITDFFKVIYEVIMKLVESIIWLTPVGVASIVAGKILSVEDIILFFNQLGWFIFTVVAGVFIYQLIILQMMYFLIVSKNPFKFYFGLIEGVLTAFATASTAAALPVTFSLMDKKVKVDPRITRFVLPIGCNINMDGTALYIAIASIFIAQMNGIFLDMGTLITVCFISMVASFSSVSVPSAGVILVSMVLSAINVSADDVSLLFAIDWLIDRFRTTNNMLGDCYTAAFVEKWSKKELQSCDLLLYQESTNPNIKKDLDDSTNLSDIVIH